MRRRPGALSTNVDKALSRTTKVHGLRHPAPDGMSFPLCSASCNTVNLGGRLLARRNRWERP